MNMDNSTITKNYETGKATAASNARKASRKSAMANLDKLASQQKTKSAVSSIRNRFKGVTGGRGGMDPTMMMFAMQAKQDADAAKEERKANARQNKEDAAIARRDQFFG